MIKLDYFKLPNYVFTADLTYNEFAVLAYLISLHTNIHSKTGDYKRVRQATIARSCGIKTTQTVSRITKSLHKKGFISHIIKAYRPDNLIGTYTYVLNTEKLYGEYTPIKRSVFTRNLNAKQLKIYLYLLKCIDKKLGYCWNSFNDISNALKIKRDEVIAIVSELVYEKCIRKTRKLRYDNRNVYSDNVYSLRKVRLIKKRVKKELQFLFCPRNCNHISTYKSRFVHLYNSTLFSLCQSVFLRVRGSPQNRSSIYKPVVLLRK